MYILKDKHFYALALSILFAYKYFVAFENPEMLGVILITN